MRARHKTREDFTLGVQAKSGAEIGLLAFGKSSPGVRDVEVTVVVPVLNEEAALGELHHRLARVLAQAADSHEIVIVDDGSVDGTDRILTSLLSDPAVRVLTLSRNFGHQAAVTAGLEHARGAAIVVMDADLQDPPELIPLMLERWRAGFHVVSAQRETRDGESAVRLILIRVFYRLLRQISQVDLPPDVGDFRLLDRRVVDVLNALPERNRYVRGLVRWVGFRHTTVPYARAARFAGRSKYPYSKLFALAFSGVTSFSTFPLRLVTYLGFALSFSSVLLAGYAVYGKLVGGRGPEGWASVVVALSMLAGAQLIALGVVGAYVGRIYEEVKARPKYVVARDSALGPPAVNDEVATERG